MQEHFKVIEQALERLYQRLSVPSAADKVHFQAALSAVKDLRRYASAPSGNGVPASAVMDAERPKGPLVTADGAPLTLPGLNIAETQALVEQGRLSAAEALAAEQASEFPRKTLIKWLEERMAGDAE